MNKQHKDALAKKLTELKLDSLVKFSSLNNINEDFKIICKTKIDPSLLGPLAPVFTSIELEIKAGINKKRNFSCFILHYSWEHHRGSNGYQVRYTYYAEDNEWEIST